MDGLLSIGDFASRCGLSVKMLRSYAAAGLLVPASVDRSTGYRYYAAHQIPRARLIVLLRRAEIPLDDIANLLAEPDTTRFDRWDEEIVAASAARRQALAQARDAFARQRPTPPTENPIMTKGPDVTTTFAAGTATHRGGRDTNADLALVGDRLFAVADGIGGLGNGDVAARLAVRALDTAFAADGSITGLLRAGREANRTVWREGSTGRQEQEASLGTTLTALAITADAAAVVLHVGDSRLYRLRAGRLTRFTRDHTVVADLVEAGELAERDVAGHPHRCVLTRAVGMAPDVVADYAGVPCEPGDRLLLCTDGAHKVLTDDDLKAVLAAGAQPHVTAGDLVRTAVERGTDDNVTAVVIDVR